MNSKKYIWVVLVLMFLTIIFIKIEKIFNKNNNDESSQIKSIDKEVKGDVINAVFYDKSNDKVEASFRDDSVTFTINTLGTITLNQAISASGSRYANPDESIVFWNKGDSVTIFKDEKIIFEGSTLKPGSIKETNNTILQDKLPSGSLSSSDSKLIEENIWVWQKTIMGDGTIVLPKKLDTFTLTFKSDGNISGKTDCNGFFGSYEIGSDGFIKFGPLASTMMYCEGSQETIFTTAINASNRYMFDNNGNLVLLLAYDSGSVLFKKK